MSYKSNIYCCVPGCTQKGTVDPEGNRVGFVGFPKDQNLRQEWLVKIRRDIGPHFKLTEATKVCSLHFHPSDVKKGIGGKKMALCKGACPSRFPWRTSPRKRHPPTLRTTEAPRCKKRHLGECLSQDSEEERYHSVSVSESTPEFSSASPIEMVEEIQESLDPSELIKHQLLQAEAEIARLNEQTRLLKENLEKSELQNEDLKSRRFCLENMTEDDSISFYTGFPNMETFQATLTYLNPGKHGENIRYWRSSESKVEKSHYDEDNHQNTISKRGRSRTLKPDDNFFLVMCRLQQGFHEQHLAFLFGISQSTISRIFISWINFMYLRFGTINIWPTRDEIDKTMPEDFKAKYPNTRVILHCTELKCQMPSSLLLNSRLFSSHKNHTTVKGLVGIAPSGAITFLSQLYSGCISDREIVERSGILDLPYDDGDGVMADKGFTINDLLPLGVSLNIPPFLGHYDQMPPEDVIKTQVIAALRIHVERAINKIKIFHIWDRVTPLSLFPILNQIWTVCGFLCNVQDPILS